MGALPERIGKFEVLSLIGRGAMGVVYKARDPYIGRLVALKRISLSDMISEDQKAEFKERFFIEARAAGGLRHPNIVTIHDVDEADGAPFMAMEFVAGGSLSKLMKERGAMPLEEAVAIVRQVALGLAYAHERGVIHRDIKPDNILLEKGGRAVITDFGAAHLLSSELTRTGEVLGTPHYMSPEQILGDPVDGRSDLFSLGVVFFLLLTGRRPFKGDTVSSVCYHIVHSPPEPVPEDLHVPPRAMPVLQRLLAKSKSERYQSGLELVDALDGLTEEETPATEESMTQAVDAPAGRSGAERPRPARATARPSSLPGAVPTRKVEDPARSSRKGFWAAPGIGFGALVVALALLVAVVAAVTTVRRAGSAAAPAPATQERAEPGLAAGPLVSSQKPRTPSSVEAPLSAEPATTTGPSSRPSAPTPRPPASPGGSAPGLTSSPPSVYAAAEVLLQDAGKVTQLTERRRFEEAFAFIDSAQKRLNQLTASAAPQDDSVLRSASEAITGARHEAQTALAAASKPILDEGNAMVDQATEGVGTDEDAIIAAYAGVCPVIRLKDRLPDGLRVSVEAFMSRCRDELNDEEWAQAQDLGKGKAFPGQS